MPFIVTCLDKQDGRELRRQTRAVHLAYMIGHQSKLLFGGPLRDEDDVVGSVMVLDLPDRSAVDSFLADEPYTRAGLFADVSIHAIDVMMPEREEGFLQRELERERGKAGG